MPERIDLTTAQPPPRAEVASTHPCPVCGGVLTLRRCPTAHRQKFVCACGYSERLAEAVRLRLAGYQELPLFAQTNGLIARDDQARGEGNHAP